jgi:hypothetical protein
MTMIRVALTKKKIIRAMKMSTKKKTRLKQEKAVLL